MNKERTNYEEKEVSCRIYRSTNVKYSKTFTEKDFLSTGVLFMIPIIGQIFWVVNLVWYLTIYKQKTIKN